MTRIPPSDGYGSNRYVIEFEKLDSIGTLLVAEQYQGSIEALPDQYRSATRLVAEEYPKGNINNSEKKIKKSSSKAGSGMQKKYSNVQEWP